MQHPHSGPSGEGAEVALVGQSTTAVALRPSTDLRDGLALGWIESHDNDSPHTAERYARDVPGWRWADGRVIPTDAPAPGAFFPWLDANGYDAFRLLPWHIEQYRRYLQTAEHVGRYVHQRRLSDSTIAGKIAAVSSYYKYAARQSREMPIPNPTVGAKRPAAPRQSQTLALSRDEVEQLREKARRSPREYALVMVLALTGLRVSELCGLDTGDLVRDSGEWMLRVTRKGGHEARVPCPEPAARALRRYMRGRRGPLFLRPDGQRLTRQAAAQTLYSLALAVFGTSDEGRARAKKVTPHALRHTVATVALEEDGVSILDVQALLGHVSVSTTQRYEHANRVRNNRAAKALGALFADDLPDVE